jgi:basic membrane protein A
MDRNCSRRDFLRWGGAGLAAGALGAATFEANAAATLKVGLALVSPAAAMGWTKQHTLGVEAIKQALGDAVDINVIDNVFQPQDAERVFRGFATSGHQLIFGTSFSHSVVMVRVAPQFPHVAFDSCSGTKVLANLGGFEARYHEGAFLAGIAAAKATKSGKLGFVGGFPIPDIVGPANAFLLGAQSSMPSITCAILFMNSWEDPGKEKDATLALMAQGCDVIAAMTDGPAVVQTAEQHGAWAVGYASDMRTFAPTRQLTALTLDWRSIYVQDAKDVLAGQWKPQSRWQGLKEGVVKMAPYADSVSADTRALLAKSEDAIKAGTLLPFAGEIRDQSGVVRVRAGGSMDETEVRSINWLVAGMQGRMKG